jgi:hypothetical protein
MAHQSCTDNACSCLGRKSSQVTGEVGECSCSPTVPSALRAHSHKPSCCWLACCWPADYVDANVNVQHGFSEDGEDWLFNVAEQPYNASITFANGTTQHFSTFERPHLLFNAQTGQPTHLVNGVSPYWDPPGAEGPCDHCDARQGSNHSCVVCKTTHGIDWTYTLVTKLNATAR